jgi:hypothetical protein
MEAERDENWRKSVQSRRQSSQTKISVLQWCLKESNIINLDGALPVYHNVECDLFCLLPWLKKKGRLQLFPVRSACHD